MRFIDKKWHRDFFAPLFIILFSDPAIQGGCIEINRFTFFSLYLFQLDPIMGYCVQARFEPIAT